MAFSGIGSGTPNDPYIITTPAQLLEINNELDKAYALGNDIDLAGYNTGAGFPGIGTGNSTGFKGGFDGRDFFIKNLYMNHTGAGIYATGLFRYVSGVGSFDMYIRNVNLTNVDITTDSNYVGSLVGYISYTSTTMPSSVIENCTVDGFTLDAVSAIWVGGLIGSATYRGIIRNSSARNGNVNGKSNVGGFVGAVGSEYTTCENCYSKSVTVTSPSAIAYIGGFVGDTAGCQLTNCWADGVTVNSTIATTTSDSYAGGFAGRINNTGGMNSKGTKVDNCFAKGSVNGQRTVGGFVGAVYKGTIEPVGYIKNSYAHIDVQSTNQTVGGFAGALFGGISVLYCYCAGALASTSTTEVGGFVGRNDGTPMTNGALFFDSTLSGKTGGTQAKTTAQLKDPATFASWDANIWFFKSGRYPKLSYEKLNFVLFEDADGIKKWNAPTSAWAVVGAAPVTEAMFLSDGMDSRALYQIKNEAIQTLGVSPKIHRYTDDTGKPASLQIKGVQVPTLVLPKGDINLASSDTVNGFNLVAAESNGGVLRTIVSVDSGVTWKAWDGASWVAVNATDLTDVKAKGMTASTLNALVRDNWTLLRGASNTLRFGYYLEVASETSVAETDQLDMYIEIVGYVKRAIVGTQYDYEYLDNQTLRVKLMENGNYKINYQE